MKEIYENFEAYKGYIDINTRNIKEQFITYFSNNKENFLKFFNIWTYSSVISNDIESLNFNLYLETKFNYNTNDSDNEEISKIIRIV